MYYHDSTMVVVVVVVVVAPRSFRIEQRDRSSVQASGVPSRLHVAFVIIFSWTSNASRAIQQIHHPSSYRVPFSYCTVESKGMFLLRSMRIFRTKEPCAASVY